MEFVWMIPLYIVVPIISILLLVSGFNAPKGEGKKKIALGLLMLSLPFLHSFLVDKFEDNREKSLKGHYALDNKSQVLLTLQSDNSFKLLKIDSLHDSGSGIWKYYGGEFRRVELIFNDSSQLEFSIHSEGEKTYLLNSFWTGTYRKYVSLTQTDNNQ